LLVILGCIDSIGGKCETHYDKMCAELKAATPRRDELVYIYADFESKNSNTEALVQPLVATAPISYMQLSSIVFLCSCPNNERFPERLQIQLYSRR
jgi:hypothetical protein